MGISAEEPAGEPVAQRGGFSASSRVIGVLLFAVIFVILEENQDVVVLPLVGSSASAGYLSFFSLLPFSSSSSSLRPNRAIRDGGILPYQLCGSRVADALGAPTRAITSFLLGGQNLSLIVTAASAWAQEGGRADRPADPQRGRVEFLAFYKPGGNVYCRLDPGSHCALDPVVEPDVWCRGRWGDAGEWGEAVRGRFAIPARAYMESFRQKAKQFIPSYVVNIMCPGLEKRLDADARPERRDKTFFVELHIGDTADVRAFTRPTLTLPVCYQHVDKVHDAVGCTEPLFGWDPMQRFWAGAPPYAGHTLLDSYIVYHTAVHKMPIVVFDATHEFHAPLERYIGDGQARRAGVWYRGGWALPDLGPTRRNDYEILAEATCHWERRLDAKWVFILHAADSYILPMEHGELIPDALARLDASTYSSVRVPMIQGFRVHDSTPGRTVLEQWPLLGGEYEFSDTRHFPLLNPRHQTHTTVHWNLGRTEDFLEDMDHFTAVDELRLHVLHILALARPKLNRRTGKADDWLDALAGLLAEALEAEGFLLS